MAKTEITIRKADEIKAVANKYEEMILHKISMLINSRKKGKTIRDINAMTGVSIGVISDLINHNSMPRIETLLRICEALDIENTELFEVMKISKKTFTHNPLNSDKIGDFIDINTLVDKNVKKCKLNKYDELGQFLAGLENTEYTKEDIAEIISYAKYIDFKKTS